MFTPPLEGSRPPLGKILDPPLHTTNLTSVYNGTDPDTAADLVHFHSLTEKIENGFGDVIVLLSGNASRSYFHKGLNKRQCSTGFNVFKRK